MQKLENFSDFISSNSFNEPVYENFAVEYSGVTSVMNKISAYNKILANEVLNSTNENFRVMHRYNQDIYFSFSEKEASKKIFGEFIPKMYESMFNELQENGIEITEELLEELKLQGFDVLNEKWDIKKSLSKIVSGAKTAAKAVGGAIDNAKEYVEDKVDKIENSTKEVKDNIVKKWKFAIEFVKKLAESGANSAREFLISAAKMLSKIGDGLADAMKKLGAFKTDDNEEVAKVPSGVPSGAFDNIKDNEESAFVSHVIAYMSIMIGNKGAEKLMEEGYDNLELNFDINELNENAVMDKIANNKFLQFILCYGKGKKISWWKSLLISIVGSLIISLGVPIVLHIAGVGAAAIPVICAAIRIVWSSRSAFKIILNRYVNKKPGEKLFDLKTCFLLAITILPQIPPFKDWIASAFSKLMKWLGLDKWIEDLEAYLGKIIGKLHGKNPSETIRTEFVDVKEGGASYVWKGDWDKSCEALSGGLENIGVKGSPIETLKKAFSGAKEIGKSSDVAKYWQDLFSNSKDFPTSMMIDTAKPGVNGKMLTIIQEICKEHPECVSGELGAEYLHGATKRLAGACNLIMNMSDDVKEELMKKATDAGIADDLIITNFGSGVAQKAKDIVEPVHWLFDSLVDSFGVMFIPWLNKKKFGKYKMSFGSNTSKLPYYVVTKVEATEMSKLMPFSNTNATNVIQKQIEDTQKLHKEYLDKIDEEKEGARKTQGFGKKLIGKIKDAFDNQKDNYEKNNDFKKRNVIVYYAKNEKGEEIPAVMFDCLSMLGCDIFKDGDFGNKKPRKNPYFMKGLFARLSFKPVDENDNDTKKFISDSLGTTVLNSVKRTYSYGIGSCIVKEEDKKFVPIYKENENDEFEAIGNFTPVEFCEILNDKSEGENSVAYEYLSGKYGKSSDDEVDSKKKRKTGSTTIENRRYVPESVKIDPNETNKKGKKCADMKMYQVDAYGMRRATPNEIKDDSIKKLDYIHARLIPMMNDEDTKLHKELCKNEDVKKLIFKKDKDGNPTDKVDADMIDVFKQYLFRSETSFSNRNAKKVCDDINKYREKKGLKELGEDAYETIKKTVETIWEYKNKTKKRKKKEKSDVNENKLLKFSDFVKLNS